MPITIGGAKALRKFFGTGKVPDPNKGSDSRTKFKSHYKLHTKGHDKHPKANIRPRTKR